MKQKKRMKHLLWCLLIHMREIYNKNIFEPNEVAKLREEIYGLKLENEALKIQAIERKKKIKSLTTT